MNSIMIVDDDKDMLDLLRRFLVGMGIHKIETFTSAEAALSRANTTIYDMIISDYRMPEMDGITFLKKFRHIQPRATRIIVSAICDKSTLYGAINEAQACRYIEKPCHADAFRAIVSEIMNERGIQVNDDISELLDVIRGLESIIDDQAKMIDELKIKTLE